MDRQTDNDERLKQVLVIRTDLQLSAGKAAAQAAHASLWAANRTEEQVRDRWEQDDLATKIVLGIEGEDELRDLASRARDAELPTSVVNDAGRTEVESGTTTALGIGPASEGEVDGLTGDLPLYR
jgi:PTH2 family peptidyl-tRNA hydrolase